MENKWTQPEPPTEGVSNYNHVILRTPVGEFRIEWKGWKETPSYDITLNEGWVDSKPSLETAKHCVESHLLKISKSLNEFINN